MSRVYHLSPGQWREIYSLTEIECDGLNEFNEVYSIDFNTFTLISDIGTLGFEVNEEEFLNVYNRTKQDSRLIKRST